MMMMKERARKVMKMMKNKYNENIYLNIISKKAIFGFKLYIKQINKFNNINKLILNNIGNFLSF